jgi:hypothetical protein
MARLHGREVGQRADLYGRALEGDDKASTHVGRLRGEASDGIYELAGI